MAPRWNEKDTNFPKTTASDVRQIAVGFGQKKLYFPQKLNTIWGRGAIFEGNNKLI